MMTAATANDAAMTANATGDASTARERPACPKAATAIAAATWVAIKVRARPNRSPISPPADARDKVPVAAIVRGSHTCSRHIEAERRQAPLAREATGKGSAG